MLQPGRIERLFERDEPTADWHPLPPQVSGQRPSDDDDHTVSEAEPPGAEEALPAQGIVPIRLTSIGVPAHTVTARFHCSMIVRFYAIQRRFHAAVAAALGADVTSCMALCLTCRAEGGPSLEPELPGDVPHQARDAEAELWGLFPHDCRHPASMPPAQPGSGAEVGARLPPHGPVLYQYAGVMLRVMLPVTHFMLAADCLLLPYWSD